MSRSSAHSRMQIALIGAGKIAREQHGPALGRDPVFLLTATVDPHRGIEGVPNYETLAGLRRRHPDLQAVAICTPPHVRFHLAREALAAGLHVLLEKPPCATVMEARALCATAAEAGRTLHFGWHSRFAPAVAPAGRWLAGRDIAKVTILWQEDVRHWHPGQDWLWQPGGMGVFDPGINALSIATAILPAFHLRRAVLEIPANRQTPIRAMLDAALENAAPLHAEFDFEQSGKPVWSLTAETRDGETLSLSEGGHALALNGRCVQLEAASEYAALYGRFAALIASGEGETDMRPLELVADACMIAARRTVGAFLDDPPRG